MTANVLPAGPVAITGATGWIGTALRRRLAAMKIEVRPVGRDDDLREGFRDAAAVVHLAGTLRPIEPDTYEEANLETVRRTIAALEGSTVRRLVFLSYLGATQNTGNRYLAAKGEAEDLVYWSPVPNVTFRSGHVFGPPDDPGPMVESLLAEHGEPVLVIGNGQQRVAPVFRDDVVDVIVRALAEAAPTGGFDLPGPEQMTLDAFVRAINGDDVRLHHVPPVVARALGHLAPSLTPTLVDVLLRDSVGDTVRARKAFGVELHSLSEVYRTPLTAAA